MSKSLTLNCGGTVDISNHLKRNTQYRAPIHKIQHVFADTVYGVLDSTGLVGELEGWSGFNDNFLYFHTTDKNQCADYSKEIRIGERFIFTKQTQVRWNGVFEAFMNFSPYWHWEDTKGFP
jgi:hypothetical protein